LPGKRPPLSGVFSIIRCSGTRSETRCRLRTQSRRAPVVRRPFAAVCSGVRLS
jgi:hypothetical protein